MANPSKQFEFIRLYPRHATDPLTGKRGEIYYNTAFDKLRLCIEETTPIWTDLGASLADTFQDRNALLIEGGQWSFASNSVLSTQDLYNHTADDTGNLITLSNTFWAGLNWIATANANVVQMTFRMSGGPSSGNMFLRIYSDAAGVPGTLLYSSDPYNSATVGGAKQDVDFVFSSPIALSSGVKYHAIIDTAVGGSGLTLWSYNAGFATPDPDNGFTFTTNGGSSWSTGTTDMYVRIVEQVSTLTQQLSWNASAYIQVPDLNNNANEIAAGSFTLDPNEVLYVDITRVDTPTTLTVVKSLIQDVAYNANRFIIARNVSGIMVVGDRLSLSANEKGSLNSLRTNFETQNNNLKVIGGGVLSNTVGAGTPTSMYTSTGGPIIFLGFDAALTFRAGARVTTPITASVNQVKFMLASNNGSLNPAGTITCDVYSDSAGFPGTLLGSSTPTSLAGITTSPALFTFNFSTPIPTNSGTAYHYIVNPTGITANGNNLNIYLSSPTDVDPNNIAIFATGGPWQSYNGDVRIEISGLVASGNAFAWSSPAYVQVAMQSLVSNRIPAGSENMDSGDIAYVQINRQDVATDLSVVIQPITDPLPLDSFILAYNDGTQIWLWNGERLLTGQSKQAGESISTAVLSTIGMSSYSDETGQLRLLPSNPASNVTLMTPANKLDINGTARSLPGNNLDVSIPGYRINWQTGTVYDYATGLVSQGTFTAPTVTIPAGQSRWYSVSLVKTTVNANNQQQYTFAILNSASATTRAAYTAGGIQVGQVFLTNTAGTIQAITYSNIIQNSQAGGSGGGGVEAKQMTLANNQVAAADITDALISAVDNRGFIMDYHITRRHLSLGGAKNTTFITNIAPGFNSQTRATVLQPDGKIVAGGDFTTFKSVSHNRVARFTVATGADDTAFTANIGTAANSIVFGVGLQSTGKIVIGGFFSQWNGNTRAKMVRLNADGTEDTAFYTNLGTGFSSDVYSVAVQPDDKILVGGDFTTLNGVTRNRFVRLNADGTVDTAFYTNMGTAFNSGGSIEAIRVQADGKILISGSFTSFNGNSRLRLIRLNSDGTEDTAFYTNLGTAFNDQMKIALQADQKILLAGNFNTFNGNSRKVVRLNANGTEDTAFQTALGTVTAGGLTGIFADSAGKIYVSGNMTNINGNARANIARLQSTGADDATWYATLGVGGMSSSVYNFIETQGMIVMSGTVTSVTGTSVGQIFAVNADASTDLQATGTIHGLYRPATSTWELGAETYAGDLTGVDFTITAAGQVQYVSSNIAGTLVESFIRFLFNKI